MRGSRGLNAWCSALLSLILLVANILAPFRTSTLGRAFLESVCQTVSDDSVDRVRPVTPVATSVGHRAVVGLAREAGCVAESGTRSQASPVFLPTPTDAFPRPQAARPGVGPTPRLRC